MRGGSLVALLALAAVSSAASGLATASAGDVDFHVDTALFWYSPPDTIALEVYESVPVGQLARGGDGNSLAETDVILLSPLGDTLAVQQWISEVEWIEDRIIVNGTILAVTPGEYDLVVVVTDLVNGLRGEAVREISAVPPGSLSELEVANAVMPAQEGSVNPLRKGGWVVFPAADGRFDIPWESRAYLYIELYGLDGGTVLRQSRLVSASGDLLFARPWDALGIPEGVSTVGLLDSIDLSAARSSGLHYLEVSVVTGSDTATTRKPLMIARDIPVQTDPSDFVAAGGDASAFFPMLGLVLSTEERSVWDRLADDEARSLFYEQYWSSRPGGRESFEANCAGSRAFTTVFREGWQTDRGRVWIRFGPPDDIERMPLQVDVLPHEIWSYYEQGNNTFIFVDRDGTGNFVQVYSSVDGEVSYSNWQQMLQPIRTQSTGDGFGDSGDI